MSNSELVGTLNDQAAALLRSRIFSGGLTPRTGYWKRTLLTNSG